MMIRNYWIRSCIGALVLASAAVLSCAHSAEHDKAVADAEHLGKYKVRLTTEREQVLGTCKYVMSIKPELDPIKIPTSYELPDYFRVHAVLAGADTVVVSERVGEAYICGPGPLNPDGTLQTIPVK
jgi:hypothetical protein